MPISTVSGQPKLSQNHFLTPAQLSTFIHLPLFILGSVLVIWCLILPSLKVILEIRAFRRLAKRPLVYLELIPPSFSTKTLLATTELYETIHGLLNASRYRSGWFRQKHVLPLEVVAKRDLGIRFLVAVEPSDLALFKQLVISYMPDIQFKQTSDYLRPALKGQKYRALEFKQTKHFAYRLANQVNLSQHDPMVYLTSSMSKLSEHELLAFQLVLSPASTKAAHKIRGRLLKGDSSQVEKSMETKLAEQLFNVAIRAVVAGPNCDLRLQGLVNALYTFQVPGYQSLEAKQPHLFKKQRLDFRLHSFQQRLPLMLSNHSAILGASEVAALYHFPYGEHIQSEDLVKSVAQSLPAPLAMKRHSDVLDFDVRLGVNNHHGQQTAIGLTAKEREKHVYIVGGTGNGKTTMLEYALLQDIKASKGVAFIDPHGDAAQKLLRYIPKNRIKDVIYLNPKDIKHPIGLNLLELPDGLDEDELLVEQERVTEAVVSVLRKVFADDQANAHRIEAMLRNTVRTAFTTESPTLFTCLELIRNSEFRRLVVSKLTDPHLQLFWREEFGKAGGMQRVSMSKGLSHRLDRFEGSEFVRRMMGQAKSTINFEDIINSGKILICNFSTDMGEDTSALFGTTVLAKLKIAAERRSEQPEATRKPFYIYVDEFQYFATTPFVKMLSASRKYKLFLTIAEQSTNQQEEQRLTEAILANVSTIVCFSLGSPSDATLLEDRFEPWLDRRSLLNQPAYNFYIRVKAEEPMEPVSGATIILPPNQASEERAKRVIASSQNNYAVLWAKFNPLTQSAKANPKTQPVSSSQRPILSVEPKALAV